MIPGEIITASEPARLAANCDLRTITVQVSNTGDRPVQVGSHYHFAEVNTSLKFDRASTMGYRLNIAAGTAIRFEPGDIREVELVALTGERKVFGFNNKVNGDLPS